MHEANFHHQHQLQEHDFLGCCKDCQRSLEIVKPHIMAFAERIEHYAAAALRALSAKQLLRHENLEMGFIPEYPEARIFRLHEEHGWVDVRRCRQPPRIMQRLSIVPVAVSHCVNQYDDFYLLTQSGALEKEPVDARGRYV